MVFDHEKLRRLAYDLTVNLNRVIDVTKYPLESTKKSNLRHRPIGIGVQGLAYVFMLLKYPFEGKHARALNKDIFETLYYGALQASIDLAETYGHYETFEGSPASKGVLVFELWSCNYSKYIQNKPVKLSGRWDFEHLRARLLLHGMRNSLLIAPMPTVSTSQIMGNSECFEPLSSNVLSKRILSGEYFYINPMLFNHLQELGIWTEAMGIKLIQNAGVVTHIKEIPKNVRDVYKTVWEMDNMVRFL
jgi:ribonucleoside-diphosphate reductase alpha chain